MISLATATQLASEQFELKSWPKSKAEAYTWVPVRHLKQLETSLFNPIDVDQLSLDPSWQVEELIELPQNFSGQDESVLFALSHGIPTIQIRIPKDTPQRVSVALPKQAMLVQWIVQAESQIELFIPSNHLHLHSWIIQDHCQVQIFEVQSSTGLQIGHHYSQIGRESLLRIVHLSLGSELSRHSWRIHLDAPLAKAELRLLSLARQNNQVHHHAEIHHHAPQTSSDQIASQVLGGQAQASFDGTVIIDRIAQESYSAQIIRSLLLSNEAKAHAKPNLKIQADNVKCSHGNTCGELDQGELFYLQSRGIPLDLAHETLTLGFCETILEETQGPFRDLLHQLIQEHLRQTAQ